MVIYFDILSSWISNYWEIAWDIGDQMVAWSGDLNGNLLGIFSFFSGIFTCLGDLDLNSLEVLFISLDREIDWEIVGSIGRSGVLSLSRSGYRESNWEFDWETVTETGLVQLVLSWFLLVRNLLVRGLFGWSGVWLADQEFDREIGSLIDRGFSGI